MCMYGQSITFWRSLWKQILTINFSYKLHQLIQKINIDPDCKHNFNLTNCWSKLTMLVFFDMPCT
jgi:hypothetical protein